MAYKYELTWIPGRNRWRKKYQGKVYYMRTVCTRKRDRETYLQALAEWNRLKAHVDGYASDPRTSTPAPSPAVPTAVAKAPSAPPNTPAKPQPPWIQTGNILHEGYPELVVSEKNRNIYTERRIFALCDYWLTVRFKQAERGELALKQAAEDKVKLSKFRLFLGVNYPEAETIDELTAEMLNVYRDKSWEFVGNGIGKGTLRKQLNTVSRFLRFLVDQNILAESPKDLSSYSRVKLDQPKPTFWTMREVRTLVAKARPDMILYIRLALNLGYSQRDISTLTSDMIDWESRVIIRDRQKTGVPTQARLWESNLALLRPYQHRRGPLLLAKNGKPLLTEHLNQNGTLIRNDTIKTAFEYLRTAAGVAGRSFKHFRKTAANRIEQVRPDLTSLFLGHAELATKRHYVQQHYGELFDEVDKLEALFFPS